MKKLFKPQIRYSLFVTRFPLKYFQISRFTVHELRVTVYCFLFTVFCLLFISCGHFSSPEYKCKTTIFNAEKYYNNENAKGFLSLWDNKSSQFKQQQKSVQEDFKKLQNINLKLKIKNVTIKKNICDVQGEGSIKAILPYNAKVKNQREVILSFKKVNNVWKIFDLKSNNLKTPLNNLGPQTELPKEKEKKEIAQTALKLIEAQKKGNYNEYFSLWDENSPIIKDMQKNFKQMAEEIKNLNYKVLQYSIELKNNKAVLNVLLEMEMNYSSTAPYKHNYKFKAKLKKQILGWKIVRFKTY